MCVCRSYGSVYSCCSWSTTTGVVVVVVEEIRRGGLCGCASVVVTVQSTAAGAGPLLLS